MGSAMSVFTILILCCWIIFFVYWFISAFSQKESAERPGIKNITIIRLFIVIPFLILFRPDWFAAGTMILKHTAASRLTGVIICAAGLVVCIWARNTIAGNWSNILDLKKDHELIRNGPYSVVRHPIYSGFLLMYLGSAVTIGTLGALIGFVILFIGCLFRIRKEEALLTTHFGTAYPEYRQQTKALIPWLY